MKVVLLLVALISGCTSLQYAGSAEYSVKPFTTDKGAVICCEVVVRNGKEIASIEASVTKFGDDYTVILKESNVMAFQGQSIAAGAMKEVIDESAKAAAAAALAPILPAIGAAVMK